MTGQQLRDALNAMPDATLDRLVCFEDAEYGLQTVRGVRVTGVNERGLIIPVEQAPDTLGPKDRQGMQRYNATILVLDGAGFER